MTTTPDKPKVSTGHTRVTLPCPAYYWYGGKPEAVTALDGVGRGQVTIFDRDGWVRVEHPDRIQLLLEPAA